MTGLKREHFGVYGVIFDDTREKVLLIKKNRGAYLGMLDLPGGRPECDEHFEDTLEREILEETGLSITYSHQLICLLNICTYEGALFRHVGVIYYVKAQGDLLNGPDGHDSDGCVWVDCSLLNEISCSPFVHQMKLSDKIYWSDLLENL